MSEFTVSQLLAAADRDARQLLGHTTPDDGPALTAAWPDLLRVAAVLLANAPQPGTTQTSDHPPTLDDHVHSMLAEATAAPPLRLPPPQRGCARIIDTWYQAAAQTSRAAHPPATNDRVLELANRADPVAVRTRVARTLATVAHLAGRELQAHTQRRVDVDAAGPRPNWVMSKGNPPPGNIEAQWIRMLHRHEHHALDHIAVPSTGSRPELGEPSQRAPGPGPTLPEASPPGRSPRFARAPTRTAARQTCAGSRSLSGPRSMPPSPWPTPPCTAASSPVRPGPTFRLGSTPPRRAGLTWPSSGAGPR